MTIQHPQCTPFFKKGAHQTLTPSKPHALRPVPSLHLPSPVPTVPVPTVASSCRPVLAVPAIRFPLFCHLVPAIPAVHTVLSLAYPYPRTLRVVPTDPAFPSPPFPFPPFPRANAKATFYKMFRAAFQLGPSALFSFTDYLRARLEELSCGRNLTPASIPLVHTINYDVAGGGGPADLSNPFVARLNGGRGTLKRKRSISEGPVPRPGVHTAAVRTWGNHTRREDASQPCKQPQ